MCVCVRVYVPVLCKCDEAPFLNIDTTSISYIGGVVSCTAMSAIPMIHVSLYVYYSVMMDDVYAGTIASKS